MKTQNQTPWEELLRQPGISPDTNTEELYRAACIGAITLLYESGNTAALAESVRHASAPESRIRALTALENLARIPAPIHDQAIRELHCLAILDNNQEAAEYLRKSSLQDSEQGWNSARMLLFDQKHQLLKQDPGPEALSELFFSGGESLQLRLISLGEKVLPNWTLLMKFLADPANTEKRAALLEKFGGFSPDERKLLRFCITAPGPAASAAADVFLRYDDETALELCLKNDLRPSDPAREALFFFLSEQWERYYASDSDYRRIRIAYEQNDPVLQRRLITVSRESGNTAWLRSISGGQDNLPDTGSLSDQHLIIRSLIEQKQWDRLLEMLPTTPMLCQSTILHALREAGYTPETAEDTTFINELFEKISAYEGLSPIPIRNKMAEAGGTAIGICGGGPYIAVLYSDKRILLWDKRDEFAQPIRIASNHLTFRKAIISPDGKYLCADCGKDGTVIFSIPGGQALKTITNDGSPLCGLYLQPDGRRLITLAQNGKGNVYAFPGGTVLHQLDLGLRDCSRAVWDPQAGLICGITLNGVCSVYDLNGRRAISVLPLSESILTAEDEFSHGRIAFIEKGETLSAINILSGKPVLDHLQIKDENARRILGFHSGDLFFLGTLSGHILLYDPTISEAIVTLNVGSRSAITGLWFDNEAMVLYACASSGSVRSWDLSLFNDMTRVIPLLQLPGFQRIDEYCKKYPEPGVKAAAAWLKAIIERRRRFDIEVDFGDE